MSSFSQVVGSRANEAKEIVTTPEVVSCQRGRVVTPEVVSCQRGRVVMPEVVSCQRGRVEVGRLPPSGVVCHADALYVLARRCLHLDKSVTSSPRQVVNAVTPHCFFSCTHNG